MTMINQCHRYRSGVYFLLVLAACVALSMWLSHYIPDTFFDQMVTPVMVGCSTLIEFVGAWLMFRHSEGLRIRKVWGYTLLVWGVADAAYIVGWLAVPTPVMNMGAYQLTIHELLIGNLLGWMLLLYPTEALRPQWLTLKRALWQLAPVFALVALDYVLPVNLAPLITLYPFILVALLISHMRAYRIWCEENFSTLDDIDVQWIMRYLIILLFIGIVFIYICLTHHHTRGFTQLWLVIFLFIYATEQILFRRDPWQLLRQAEKGGESEADAEHIPDETEETTANKEARAAYRETLERWMESEKPYVNPDFRLIDLRKVLPLNRTYLSQFIHAEYGCSFYQFVNRYRIEEAKRLKLENPDMKVGEVSARCGFSSPTVFGRVFLNITGVTPRKWAGTVVP